MLTGALRVPIGRIIGLGSARPGGRSRLLLSAGPVRRTAGRGAGYPPEVPRPETEESERSDGSEESPTPATSGTLPTAGSAPRRRRWLVRGLLAAAALVVLVLAVQSVVAITALRDAQRAQRAVASDLSGADLAAAQRHADDLGAATRRARAAVWGPWWALPEAVPWYGDDVRAVRHTVRALDDVARQAVIPLVDTTAQIEDGLRRPDGTVDVEVLDRLQRRLAAASAPAAAAARDLSQINPAGLAGPLRPTIVQVRDGVARLADTVQSAGDGLVVARAVIGAEHARTTLLAVQNPAEARGTGGILSAWALLRGSEGKVSLAATGVNDQLIRFPADASDAPADVLELYGDQMLDVRNINMSPDFPVAARLLADGYRRFSDSSGSPELASDALVLTVTPRALGRLLAVTGPVEVPGYDKPITSDNAASMFTNGVYRVFPEDGPRTRFVQQVLVQVFARLQQPGVKPIELVRQLQRMVGDRDVMAWSPEQRVEDAVRRLGMSGALTAPDGSTVRLSLLNTDGSKLDYYLRVAVTLSGSGADRTLEVTLRNTAPTTVPAYVRNQDPRTELPGTTHDVVLQVHLPPDVDVTHVTRDGSQVGVANGTEAGWRVVRLSVRLPQGSSSTLQLQLTRAGALRDVVPPVMTSRVNVTLSSLS